MCLVRVWITKIGCQLLYLIPIILPHLYFEDSYPLPQTCYFQSFSIWLSITWFVVFLFLIVCLVLFWIPEKVEGWIISFTVTDLLSIPNK